MSWADRFSSKGFGCLVEFCCKIALGNLGPLDFNFRVERLVTLGSLNPSNQVNVLAAKKVALLYKSFPLRRPPCMHRQPFKEFLENQMTWHQTSRYHGQKRENEYENHKALVLDFTGDQRIL